MLDNRLKRGDYIISALKLANVSGLTESELLKAKFLGLTPINQTIQMDKHIKILTHRNNKFLKVDDVNLGEETVSAMRSELYESDSHKLYRLQAYINKQSDRMLTNKMNAESRAYSHSKKDFMSDHQ